jgi:hypothetical protein
MRAGANCETRIVDKQSNLRVIDYLYLLYPYSGYKYQLRVVFKAICDKDHQKQGV